MSSFFPPLYLLNERRYLTKLITVTHSLPGQYDTDDIEVWVKGQGRPAMAIEIL